MTAIRCCQMLVLAALLAATPAAADTVVTAQEVISCSAVSASADSVRLTLAQGKSRTLPAWDVYEVRVSDTARVAELAALLWRSSVIPDSDLPVPPPHVRTRAAMRLRLDRAREHRGEGLSGHADFVDTLAGGASPDAMTTRCWEMEAVLRECGRSDNTVFDLLREVSREQEALRRLRPKWGKSIFGVVGAAVGGPVGCGVGEDIRPTMLYSDCIGIGPGGHPPTNCELVWGGGPVGCLVGTLVGTAAGFLGGAAVDLAWSAVLVAKHRGRVNGLIRRVNRAVLAAP